MHCLTRITIDSAALGHLVSLCLTFTTNSESTKLSDLNSRNDTDVDSQDDVPEIAPLRSLSRCYQQT